MSCLLKTSAREGGGGSTQWLAVVIWPRTFANLISPGRSMPIRFSQLERALASWQDGGGGLLVVKVFNGAVLLKWSVLDKNDGPIEFDPVKRDEPGRALSTAIGAQCTNVKPVEPVVPPHTLRRIVASACAGVSTPWYKQRTRHEHQTREHVSTAKRLPPPPFGIFSSPHFDTPKKNTVGRQRLFPSSSVQHLGFPSRAAPSPSPPPAPSSSPSRSG